MNISKKYTLLSLTILLYAIGTTSLCSEIDKNTCHNHDSLRKRLNKGYINKDGTMKSPSIKILEEEPEGERYGECHNYAISKTLGLKGQIPKILAIAGCSDWHTEFNFLGDYCQPVSIPQKGDLIIYKPDQLSNDILHTGLVYDPNNDLVESKWTTWKDVLVHPTYHLPSAWGNYVEYYRPIKTNDEIILDIQRKKICFQDEPFVNDPHSGQQYTRLNTRDKYARLNSDFIVIIDFVGNNARRCAHNGIIFDNSKDFASYMLQQYMSIDIDTVNNNGQTPLMIAAKHNNTELAQLLITHKANINLKDNEGNTAFKTAVNNNNIAMIHLLLEQRECNKELRDNMRHKALYHEYENYTLALSESAKQDFWHRNKFIE